MRAIRRPTRGQAVSVVGGLLVAMLVMAGCAGSTGPSTGASATPTDTAVPAPTNTAAPVPTANPNTVMIGGALGNFKFEPASLTVKVGAKVTWVNDTQAPHTATSDSGSAVTWDSGLLDPGGSFSFTFTKAGTFTYHCSVHSYMHGTIVVTS
jgi:plastocyanin